MDGLRAVAVVLVMAYHFGAPVPGRLGVSIFFVLSGFLITSLLLEEYRATGGLGFRRFYLRRTLRIFPAYYALLAVSILILAAHDNVLSAGRASALVTYTLNYFHAINGHPTLPLGHAWSLAVEEQFYLLWPLTLLFLLRRGGVAYAGRAVAWLILLVVAWRSWLVANNASEAWIYEAFDTRFDMLLTGGLLAIVVRSRHWPEISRRLTARAWLPCIPAALLVVSQYAPVWPWTYRAGLTVDALLIAILLAQLVPLSRSSGWRWLNHPVLTRIGALSYSLYLYHEWGAYVGNSLSTRPLVAAALSTAGTFVMAIASYRYVERPALAMRKRLEREWLPDASPRPAAGRTVAA